jgi:hypothetical protein
MPVKKFLLLEIGGYCKADNCKEYNSDERTCNLCKPYFTNCKY